jgi:hypothetical protein
MQASWWNHEYGIRILTFLCCSNWYNGESGKKFSVACALSAKVTPIGVCIASATGAGGAGISEHRMNTLASRWTVTGTTSGGGGGS